MQRNGPFKGRTIAVVNDLSLDEQRYLYRKARELKSLSLSRGDVRKFKIDDRDYQVYLIFMEDSTRTRESFRNAAKFLGCRTNMFDTATSSFNKNESITDAIKMLYGYSADSCFILRTKLEGVCRSLQGSLSRYAEISGGPRPGFINAGDGKHEHPTQEFLDEFSFLEQMHWNEDHIHLALTGDLYHGRTVHSKADGLRVFRNVEVDLVAPELLSMPPYYVEKMKDNGYQVNVYESLDEYLASGKVAPIWYFTRLQLERMGESVLERAPLLRRSVTFRKDMLSRLPEGARFYHPLPRDRNNPTNPCFLDELPLNGWDAQSANGYWTRIIEIGMVSGLLGEDFEGAFAMEPEIIEDFVVEAKRVFDRLTQRMILLENQDAMHLAAGVIRVGQAELRAGAEHAVAHDPAHVDGGHLAPAQLGANHRNGNERAVEDVVRAGDDGRHLGTDIHFADMQVVGIVVLDDGEHATDDDAFHAGEFLLHTRAFETAPHHLLNEFVV